MGGAGLTRATQVAVLNANYIAARLREHYPVLYSGHDGIVAHECILDLRELTRRTGVSVDDVAKRLIDYGFHAPTMSFPVAGTLMVEPTESEDLYELDRFCEAMIAIRGEIAEVEAGEVPVADSMLRNAPHTAAALASKWEYPYERSSAAFPVGVEAGDKYWPPVSRIDGAYGTAIWCARARRRSPSRSRTRQDCGNLPCRRTPPGAPALSCIHRGRSPGQPNPAGREGRLGRRLSRAAERTRTEEPLSVLSTQICEGMRLRSSATWLTTPTARPPSRRPSSTAITCSRLSSSSVPKTSSTKSVWRSKPPASSRTASARPRARARDAMKASPPERVEVSRLCPVQRSWTLRPRPLRAPRAARPSECWSR